MTKLLTQYLLRQNVATTDRWFLNMNKFSVFSNLIFIMTLIYVFNINFINSELLSIILFNSSISYHRINTVGLRFTSSDAKKDSTEMSEIEAPAQSSSSFDLNEDIINTRSMDIFDGESKAMSPIIGLAEGPGSKINMPSDETREFIGDVLENASIGATLGMVVGAKLGNPVTGGLIGTTLGAGVKVAEKIVDDYNKKIQEESENQDSIHNISSTPTSSSDSYNINSTNELNFSDSLFTWLDSHIMSSNEGNLILCIFILTIVSLYLIIILLLNILINRNKDYITTLLNNKVFKFISYIFLIRNNFLIYYYLLLLFIINLFNASFLYILLNYSLIIK